ncbi:Xaa-Pro peptidase family protein [Caulobacter sp. S45]|uniref:M24 family metallopeptidase n=1 Tax=Caulobacter sp. S45 TaxID=1641861 RepID=UPI00131DF93E|nr:Xaa-Pro peptidase family protein [Caulobacter sp. S45]
MTKGVGGSTAQHELAQIRPWAHRAPVIAREEYVARQEAARALLDKVGADSLIVGAGHSLRYFTGVAWGATERLVALILPRTGRPIMICPAFEIGSMLASLLVDADIRLWEEDESPFVLAAKAAGEFGGTLAFDPALPFSAFGGVRQAAPALRIVDGAPVIDGCRKIKSAAELALLSQAKAMTLEVHRRAAAMLQPGIKASEVRRFIDSAHRAIGGDNGSSFCAVQFEQATAFPHGIPGDQELREGDLVLIDTGCLVQGYNSDITRTYVFGQPNDDQRRIWDIEHAAQAAAFDAVRPGVACEHIDQVAREVLQSHDLGPDYRLPGLPHRTGHGVGLSIHEPAYLVRGDKTPLAPGMCFSNEPMIVIPDRFGVRLEDHFYVTENGGAWFTEPSPSIDQPFG